MGQILPVMVRCTHPWVQIYEEFCGSRMILVNTKSNSCLHKNQLELIYK